MEKEMRMGIEIRNEEAQISMEENQITFRNFTGGYGVSEDYIKVHEFLVKSQNVAYTYARFDWMITHSYLEEQYLNRIGLWEEKGRVVAAALYDTSLDDVFLITLAGYKFLYSKMISYACTHMVKEENPDFRLFIEDSNNALKKAAEENGFSKTQNLDKVACYDLSKDIAWSELANGFSIVSLADERDYDKYLHCLFRGFDHDNGQEQYSYTEADFKEAQTAYERKYVDLNLKISVKALDGSYIAHCGMWYDAESQFAVIEPVCTDPDYRKQGFGRAAVIEGLRRVKEMGAKYAFVGSDQQFYYSIGLYPHSQGTFWVK